MSSLAVQVAWSLALTGSMHAAGNRIWIVDPSGSGSFTEIQPAISAAADGDVILVRSGEYLPFQIEGRSLRVLADVGAEVEIYGTVTVRDLPANAIVVLGGLEVLGTAGTSPSSPGLALLDNAGFIRIEDCEFTGGYNTGGSLCYEILDGGPGVYAEASARVAFVASTLWGGSGGMDYWGDCDGREGGTGLASIDSIVALYDCTVRGGPGGSTDEPFSHAHGGRGGQGCHPVGGQLFASRTLFWGGAGGLHWNGGNGGDGFEFDDGQVDLRSCVFRAGPGASGLFGSSGKNGQGRMGSGVIHFLSGPARIFDGPLLATETGPLRITVTGQAGDRVWIVRSTSLAHRFVPTLGGERMVRAPVWMTLDPQGIVPATGELVLDLPQSPLPAGAEFDGAFLQGIVEDSSGNMLLCGPMHPTVLR